MSAVPSTTDTIRRNDTRPAAASLGLVWGAVLLAIVLWASAFPGIRAGLRDLSPVDLVTLRLWSAAIIMAGYALATRMRMPERGDWGRLVMAGLLGMTLYQLGLSLGETRVSAGAASLLVNTGPIFGAVLAWAVLKEQVRPAGWIGIALSFLGATVIALGQGGGGLRLSPQALLVIGSAICATIYSILQKPMLTRYSPMEFTSYAIWIGALFLAPNLPHFAHAALQFPARAWEAGLYLAAVPTVIAFALFAYALTHLPYSRMVSAFYLIPVFAFILSYFWLGEVPGARSIVGGAIVLAGVIVVNTYGRVHTAPRLESGDNA